jgi:hypothetical protein
MEFSDDELSEGIYESAELVKSLISLSQSLNAWLLTTALMLM